MQNQGQSNKQQSDRGQKKGKDGDANSDATNSNKEKNAAISKDSYFDAVCYQFKYQIENLVQYVMFNR
jgi:hypothetical protein